MGIKILVLGNRDDHSNSSYINAIESLGEIAYYPNRMYKNKERFYDHIRRCRIDIVAMSNPYLSALRLEMYNALRNVSFPIVVFDRGGLPDSWFFDTGFNADSDSYRLEHWDHPLSEPEKHKVQDYILRVRESDHTLEAQGKRIGPNRLRETLRIGDKKVLFVPFQRPQDATIQHFSGFVRDIPHFTSIIEEIGALFSSHCPDWIVIAKQHPLETDFLSDKILTVPADTHIHDLLELSEAVCLVNSGVGLLAALFDKPVFHFGKTYYSHPDLNRSVESAGAVVACIKNGHLPFKKEVRDRLIHHLRYKVYSFGKPKTDIVPNKDGSFRNVTSHAQFSEIRLPDSIMALSTRPEKKIFSLSPRLSPYQSTGAAPNEQTP